MFELVEKFFDCLSRKKVEGSLPTVMAQALGV
jgi:hypothetical protein